ncbi:proteasome assembly chaperone 1-like [Tigriopus californicus]|uniref:proteasome assembly chaperone 1-like n=1 Tax=Tigriopus californicus TaxID=6832 RepID=UPI0027D9E865|nr:proteasome assembly chaperone 1-like [Tigriopus californicus]
MVSLTFGEVVVDRPSRRYNLEDEDDPVPRLYELFFEGPKAQTLLLATNEVALGFSSLYFLTAGQKPDGKIVETLKDEQSSSRDVCHIFTVTKGLIVCHALDANPDLNYVNDIGSKILELLETEAHIIILASDSLSNFKTVDLELDRQSDLLRKLVSDSWQESTSWSSPPPPPLESPNMVSGIPAALMTFAQFKKIPCLILINYVDSKTLDSITLQGFKKVFEIPLLQSFSPTIPQKNVEKRLRELISKVEQGNLYI